MKTLIDIIDEAVRQSKVIVEDNTKYVVKHYSVEPGIVKWFIIKSLSLPLQIYPYVTSPRERMAREISFFNKRPGGVYTPRVIDIDWNNHVIKREYIEGEIFDPKMKRVRYVELANTLSRIHRGGYALGDSKYTNFIFTGDGRVYVVDAEQATETSNSIHYSWDIIIFTVTTLYSYGLLRDIETIYNKLRIFYSSYTDYYGVDPIANIVEKVRLRTLFSILIPLPHNIQLLNIIKSIVSK